MARQNVFICGGVAMLMGMLFGMAMGSKRIPSSRTQTRPALEEPP